MNKWIKKLFAMGDDYKKELLSIGTPFSEDQDLEWIRKELHRVCFHAVGLPDYWVNECHDEWLREKAIEIIAESRGEKRPVDVDELLTNRP